MQPLDDDMDELFRRASEEYPLNTNGSDWNKVLQQLHAKEEDLPKFEKGKRDYKYLWLLLLLPIGFVCGRYIGTSKVAPEVMIHKQGNTPSSKLAKAKIATPLGTSGNTVEKDTTPGYGVQKVDPTIDGSNGGDAKVVATNGIGKAIDNKSTKISTVIASTFGHAGESNQHKLAGASHSFRSVNHPSANSAGAVAKVIGGGAVEIPAATLEKPTANAELVTSSISSAKPADSFATPSKNTVEVTKAVTVKESDGIKQKHFKSILSYSLILGPDISTVKSQKTSNVGYSFGLMVKYQFAKRLTLETGALWERKNYYTAGKYMDTTGLKLPMHSIISTANGYCNMVEIPINIRYDFISKPNHSWFVSTGLSSYLMNKEYYDISYERYGQPYMKDYDYANSTRDWFSILSLSAGYQKLIGKHTTLGIAPYVKLPFKGIGIGKLPVSSTGIYFSISRSIK